MTGIGLNSYLTAVFLVFLGSAPAEPLPSESVSQGSGQRCPEPGGMPVYRNRNNPYLQNPFSTSYYRAWSAVQSARMQQQRASMPTPSRVAPQPEPVETARNAPPASSSIMQVSQPAPSAPLATSARVASRKPVVQDIEKPRPSSHRPSVFARMFHKSPEATAKIPSGKPSKAGEPQRIALEQEKAKKIVIGKPLTSPGHPVKSMELKSAGIPILPDAPPIDGGVPTTSVTRPQFRSIAQSESARSVELIPSLPPRNDSSGRPMVIKTATASQVAAVRANFPKAEATKRSLERIQPVVNEPARLNLGINGNSSAPIAEIPAPVAKKYSSAYSK